MKNTVRRELFFVVRSQPFHKCLANSLQVTSAIYWDVGYTINQLNMIAGNNLLLVYISALLLCIPEVIMHFHILSNIFEVMCCKHSISDVNFFMEKHWQYPCEKYWNGLNNFIAIKLPSGDMLLR